MKTRRTGKEREEVEHLEVNAEGEAKKEVVMVLIVE